MVLLNQFSMFSRNLSTLPAAAWNIAASAFLTLRFSILPMASR